MSKLSDRIRKRLEIEYRKTKSYAKMAKKYRVTKGVMYNFLANGIIPANLEYKNSLGLIKPKQDKSSKILYTRQVQIELKAIAIYWGYKSWSDYCTQVRKDFRENLRDGKYQN